MQDLKIISDSNVPPADETHDDAPVSSSEA